MRARRAAWLCAIQHNREFGASAERKRSYPVSVPVSSNPSRPLVEQLGWHRGRGEVVRAYVRARVRACVRARERRDGESVLVSRSSPPVFLRTRVGSIFPRLWHVGL